MREYDYSSDGAYFVTICTDQKKHSLARIVDRGPTEKPEIILTSIGEIIESYIKTIPGIDKYVIMPNHVHLILIKDNGKPLASDIRSFKGLSSKKAGVQIWQNSYYEHVIRDEEDYKTKWKYIDDNPAKWVKDEYYSAEP